MKNKSVFWLLITMIIIGFAGVAVTLILMFVFTNSKTEIFDFSNINFISMGLGIIIGLLFICFVFSVMLFFISKKLFKYLKIE